MLTVHVESSPSRFGRFGRAGDAGPPTVMLLCHGRIVMGLEAETLRCIAAARTERRVIVDLHDVSGMDAAGLGLLVELHRRARQRTAQLSLTRPSSCVRRLLSLTRLDSVLDVDNSRAQMDWIGCERSAMTA